MLAIKCSERKSLLKSVAARTLRGKLLGPDTTSDCIGRLRAMNDDRVESPRMAYSTQVQTWQAAIVRPPSCFFRLLLIVDLLPRPICKSGRDPASAGSARRLPHTTYPYLHPPRYTNTGALPRRGRTRWSCRMLLGVKARALWLDRDTAESIIPVIVHGARGPIGDTSSRRSP